MKRWWLRWQGAVVLVLGFLAVLALIVGILLLMFFTNDLHST